MKNKHCKFLCVLLILIFIVSSNVYANVADIKYIDIMLTRPRVENKLINLESDNGFSIYSIGDKSIPISVIESNEIRVVLDEMDNFSLLNSGGNVLFTIPKGSNLLLKSRGGQDPTIKVEKYRYRGYLRFKAENRDIILINHVDMEEYLYGLVPAEMGYNSPKEALKAQAVAARTYATGNLSKHLAEGYNLCDSTHCQVYFGYDKENPLTNEAVDETKGLLVYYEGNPIKAFYHSTSSGFTESSVDVWGGDLPYLSSVRDDFSLDTPQSNWTIKVDIFELNSKLIENDINIGLLEGIKIIESSPTGSVKKVKLIGSNGEEDISGLKFRTIVGNTTLKSTWFNIVGENAENIDREVYIIGKDGKIISKKLSELSVLDRGTRKSVSRGGTSRSINKDSRIEDLFREQSVTNISTSEIIIEGKGYGHGVGMSQNGAKKMAEEGYTFEEILKYYYTGIDIL